MATCPVCSETFEHTAEEAALRSKIASLMPVPAFPAPALCRDCRMARRMAWRNERVLYQRTCDATGKSIISVYPSDALFPVYDKTYWWSDAWDPLAYGRAYDPTRSFFEQLQELQRAVPRASLNTKNVENCDYCNFAFDSRNSYLAICCYFSESILYSYWMLECKDCTDCSYCFRSQQCLDCTDCNDTYGCISCVQCNSCRDSAHLFDCRGCSHCFCCVGLRNAQYHMFNEKLAKEEYEKRVIQFDLQNPEHVATVRRRLHTLRSTHPHKYVVIEQCEDSTGDHIVELKHCHNCFQMFRSRDCINCGDADGNQDLLDSYHPGWSEVLYDCYSPVRLKNAAFCCQCWDGNDVYYCDTCQNCSFCFGCVSLRRSRNCILNKQYTKEEYETLIQMIIAHMRERGEWGQFFPPQLGPFAYNETVAQDEFSLEKSTALQRGFRWQNALPYTKTKETIAWSAVPQCIDDVPDSIIREVLTCTTCAKSYRLISQELKFYREKQLPVPRICPDCRHLTRIAHRNPRKLWDRTCAQCGKAMRTTFAPERPEIVYCEECYLKAVY
jgi:CxxC-x17-CxxC domain-containing protein